jgi:hypothetical protein
MTSLSSTMSTAATTVSSVWDLKFQDSRSMDNFHGGQRIGHGASVRTSGFGLRNSGSGTELIRW